MWDVSAGGAVQSGEDSFTAARREALEEVGIDIGETPIRARFTLNFVRGFDDFFLVEKPQQSSLNLQEAEVSDARWASLEEILQMLEKGEFVPYHADFIKAVFAMRYDTGPHRIYKNPLKNPKY